MYTGYCNTLKYICNSCNACKYVVFTILYDAVSYYMVIVYGMGNNPMVGATVAVAVSIEEAAKAGKF